MKSMPSPVEALREGQASGKTKPNVVAAAAPGKGGKAEAMKYSDGMLGQGAKALKAHDEKGCRKL